MENLERGKADRIDRDADHFDSLLVEIANKIGADDIQKAKESARLVSERRVVYHWRMMAHIPDKVSGDTRPQD